MNRPPTFNQVGIDQVGAYWDARPCNLRHSSQAVGSEPYFAEVEAKKYRVEPHIPQFADFSRWQGKGSWNSAAAWAPTPSTSLGLGPV